MLFIKENWFAYAYDTELVVIEAWGRDSLWVRSGINNRLPEADWALIEPEERYLLKQKRRLSRFLYLLPKIPI